MTGVTLQAPSLLDRLLDDAPDRLVDPPRTREQVVRDTRAALRRDLEILLNTRFAPASPPPNLAELRFSLLRFGLPDFIGTGMTGRNQRDGFAREIEATIRMFEPRLRDVHVAVLVQRQETERLVQLRIEAVAVLHEGRVPVTLFSALDPATLRLMVNEDRGDTSDGR